MSHKRMLEDLLSGKTIKVYETSGVIGTVYRFAGDKLISYVYQPVQKQWKLHRDVGPLNLVMVPYIGYRVDSRMDGEVDHTSDEIVTTILDISDRQFVTDMLTNEYLRYERDGVVCLMGLTSEGFFFNMTEQQWLARDLWEFIDRRGVSYADHLNTLQIKQLLNGSCLMVSTNSNNTVMAFQITDGHLETFIKTIQNPVWCRTNELTVERLIQLSILKCKEIDRIGNYDDKVSKSLEKSIDLSDQNILKIYAQYNHLVYQTKQTIRYVTSSEYGESDMRNWLGHDSEFHTVVTSLPKLKKKLKTPLDVLKFKLYFDRGIDVTRWSRKKIDERFKAVTEVIPERYATIILNYYGLCGHEVKTLQQIGNNIGLSASRTGYLLTIAFRYIRHPSRYSILMNEKLKEQPSEEPKSESRSFETFDNLQLAKATDINVLYLYTASIAGIDVNT